MEIRQQMKVEKEQPAQCSIMECEIEMTKRRQIKGVTDESGWQIEMKNHEHGK